MTNEHAVEAQFHSGESERERLLNRIRDLEEALGRANETLDYAGFSKVAVSGEVK